MEATELAIAALTRSYGILERAADGLSDEQFHHLPTPDSNSIAWLVWHLSRWKDNNASRLSGQQSVWEGQGWAEKFGMAADAAGMGDTPEQVAAFRPKRELLFGYASAAQAAALERIALLKPADLDRDVETPWGTRSAGLILTASLNDSIQHIGQIAYLRGMLTGRGWLAV
jgi:hypothetical protein